MKKKSNFEEMTVNKIQLTSSNSFENSQESDVSMDISGTISKIGLKKTKNKNDTLCMDEFPVDWTIKSKIRFTSKTPFSWTNHIHSMSESIGISSFVQDSDVPKFQIQQGLSVWIN
jgi:hypothetical protein